MKVDLNGKVALVTGSGGAIGCEIALKMAENGADVVVNDVHPENALKVVREIEAMGRKAIFVQADISCREAMEEMACKAVEAFGKVDILVNNAGTNVGPEGRKPIYEFRDEDWNKLININLNGIYYCSKPIIKNMVERNYGKIINISSVAGLVPLRLQSAFVAAKAGVLELSRAMAIELAPHGILVNAIAPGSIMMEGTKLLFYSDEEKAESMLSHIPLKRPGKPPEIANAALFLASDDSSYMTGSVMVVDGGWTCGYNREW